MEEGRNNNRNDVNKTRTILFWVRIMFLAVSVLVVYKIVKIQYFWEPIPATRKYFCPQTKKKVVDPVRGSILAHDGKILASATPMYKIEMDCTVRREEFEGKEKGDSLEKEWREKAKILSAGLADIIGNKSADSYYKEIIHKRESRNPNYKIADEVDHETLLALKELPLFNESSFHGGLVVSKMDTRQYPYGDIARRTIGHVKNNKDTTNNKLGIEGKYDKTLHGKEGLKYMKIADRYERIPDMDSTVIKVEDGADVRTTIDIEIQNIADRAMRHFLQDSQVSDRIVEGCAIVMEVETGAIRAMVNLKKGTDGSIFEGYNYAVGRKGEPGSVFKVVSIMTCLEDGKIKSLKDSVPTFKGVWDYAGQRFTDTEHLNAKRFPSGYVKLEDALMISSNNAFRYLVADRYDKNPQRYVDKVKKYGFLENFEFDLSGLGKTSLPTIDKKQPWTFQDLAQLGMGYAVELTPLHLISLYNGIANGGKLMKPYLVEDIEKNGHIIKKYGPKVLNSSMCSQATCDTITRGLLRVTTGRANERNYGTAYYAFLRSKCKVAGKTGTARMKIMSNAKRGDPYMTIDGRRQFQATFVGYFPAERPKYSILAVGYSKPIIGNLYGSESAKAVRQICDAVYGLDPEWGEEYKDKGRVPSAKKTKLSALISERGKVPDLNGLGLTDAIYSIENSGYHCNYSGTGHVRSQSPAAGSKYGEGQTINIVLR